MGSDAGTSAASEATPPSTSGVSHENRDFLASRIATYVAVMFWLRVAIVVVVPAVGFIFAMEGAKLWIFTPPGRLTLALLLGLGATMMVLRRMRLSTRELRLLDVFVTLALGATATPQILLATPNERPELKVLFSVTHLLVIRAALVPSHPSRTAALGLAVVAPIPLAALRVHTDSGSYLPSPIGPMLDAAFWGLFGAAVSTVVSAVIYGLHRRVREAARLGQYTLERKLGEGGMGVVYQARHALLRRPTAIKLLSPDRMGDAARSRFEREVQVTAKLSHPNIVSVYDFGHSPGGVFYYAMEYIDGIDLEQLVASDGPQPPGRVLALLHQAAAALAEAHAVRLIHRDIKPANMILTQRASESDVLKIVDFGLVKEVDHASSDLLSDVRTLRGTPLYMAPEAIVSPDTIDPRSDLYALGAVGYFLLTAAPVFDGKNVLALLGQHTHARPTPPSERVGDLPPKLERVVMRCLEKQPADRYADARELMRDLAACDDVPAWTPVDAAGWWGRRAVAAEPRAHGTVSPFEATLAVDLQGRALGS